MNSYDKVIEYLKLHKQLEYDIEFYRTKMEGLKAISYSQEEKGTSMDDMMSIYMQKIEKAENKQREIENFIEDKFEGRARVVIYKKYVENQTLKEIGTDHSYATSYIGRLIDKAIYGLLAKG